MFFAVALQDRSAGAYPNGEDPSSFGHHLARAISRRNARVQRNNHDKNSVG
jgi:hypothetical protein